MRNKLFYVKLIGSIVVSFIIVRILMQMFFLSNSPRVRPYLGENIISNISHGINSLFLSRNFNKDNQNRELNIINTSDQSTLASSVQDVKNNLLGIPFESVQKGIYQKIDKSSTYILIKEKEVDWVQNKMAISGKDSLVLIPKGEEKPVVNVLE